VNSQRQTILFFLLCFDFNFNFLLLVSPCYLKEYRCHTFFFFSRMPNTVYMRDKSSGSLKIIAEYGQDYGNENQDYHGYGHYDAPPSVIGGAPPKQ
jgi:OTU domain-containing protein 6